MKKIFKLLTLLILSVTMLTGCDIDTLLDIIEIIPVEDSASISSDGRLMVKFIDVGQGDSALVVLPNGENMLIDAGLSDSYEAIDSNLKECGINQIDYLIATHPHADHIGSLDDVINNYDIGEIYMPNATTTTKTFESALTAVKNKGKQINSTKAGMTIYESADTLVETLAPNSNEYSEMNNYSIVLKITYKNNSILFTGDAESDSEKEMLDAGYDVSADVLKLGHHGSSSSTTSNFLKAVNPEYAIISCGVDNSYGHPHRETMEKLSKYNIPTYRTDIHGTITLISDGNNLVFETEKGE